MKYCLLILISFASISIKCQEPITKIFVVRHADRLGQNDDLSTSGLKRAQELKRILRFVKIDSIFSTDSKRTKETAAPLAELQRLPIGIYKDIPTIVNHIITQCQGKTILIVAHSNTVSDLIKQCGCKPPASTVPSIPSTQFDNLFLLITQGKTNPDDGQCELIHMKYGAPTN